MSVSFEITAQPRSDTGKGASRRLRRTGMVPGIIYGGHQEPSMISLAHNELILHLDHEAFYSHILNLKVGDATEQVVLKDLQRHPAKPFIMHIDFQRISAGEKIRMQVPLHFTNQETAPGTKAGGQASHMLSDVEITCLPKDLPEFIEVDMGEMNVGDAIHLSELKLPAGVELPSSEHEDTIVVNIHSGHAAADEDETEEGAAE
ncbi:50S ribosomal protein L25/general stress protein Ctc [Candidatus Endoriftia persephonae]|nr:50S ribosomal protein L25/general stress protein Ctc [Candidatus Endoriftia persephone]USF87980.1 50S ribosomal protein L25/general stress protein Ctc [Candidatus Endoriftia persephone]